jgi:hypothetical protein
MLNNTNSIGELQEMASQYTQVSIEEAGSPFINCTEAPVVSFFVGVSTQDMGTQAKTAGKNLGVNCHSLHFRYPSVPNTASHI